MKDVRIRSYSAPYFLAFELNTKRYGVFLRIQFECEKIRTRITPNTETFFAVSTAGLFWFFCVHLLRIVNFSLLLNFVLILFVSSILVYLLNLCIPALTNSVHWIMFTKELTNAKLKNYEIAFISRQFHETSCWGKTW